jgi:hypothetical protein
MLVNQSVNYVGELDPTENTESAEKKKSKESYSVYTLNGYVIFLHLLCALDVLCG